MYTYITRTLLSLSLSPSWCSMLFLQRRRYARARPISILRNDEIIGGLEPLLNYMNENLFSKDDPAINEHHYVRLSLLRFLDSTSEKLPTDMRIPPLNKPSPVSVYVTDKGISGSRFGNNKQQLWWKSVGLADPLGWDQIVPENRFQRRTLQHQDCVYAWIKPSEVQNQNLNLSKEIGRVTRRPRVFQWVP